jgi:hypothetical protein
MLRAVEFRWAWQTSACPSEWGHPCSLSLSSKERESPSLLCLLFKRRQKSGFHMKSLMFKKSINNEFHFCKLLCLFSSQMPPCHRVVTNGVSFMPLHYAMLLGDPSVTRPGDRGRGMKKNQIVIFATCIKTWDLISINVLTSFVEWSVYMSLFLTKLWASQGHPPNLPQLWPSSRRLHTSQETSNCLLNKVIIVTGYK